MLYSSYVATASLYVDPTESPPRRYVVPVPGEFAYEYVVPPSLLNLSLYPLIPPPVTAGQLTSAYPLNPRYPDVSIPTDLDTDVTLSGPVVSTVIGLVGVTF